MALNFNPLGKKITDILGGFGQFANKTGQVIGGGVNNAINQGVVQPVLRGGQQLTNISNATNLNPNIRAQAKPVDLRQFGSDFLTTGLNFASLGEGKALLTGANALKQRVLRGVGEGAAIGGAQGAASTFANPNATAGDYGRNIALGTGLGGAAGGALPVVGAAIRPAAKNMKVTLANQEGRLGPAKRPSHQELIEAASNKGDMNEVGRIISSMPDADPYKESMRSLFADRLPKPTVKAAAAKPQVALKTRGFRENVAKNFEGDTAQAVVEAIPGYKPIKNQTTLRKAATEIEKNPQAAYARLITKQQLTSADDVATGNALLRRAVDAEDIESAIEIGKKLGIDGTKLGQAVQAYATLRKTTPEGIVSYASKQAGKAGRELDPVATRELVAKAKAVAGMPEGPEKIRATRELTGQADKLGHTWRDTVGNILNAPRAALATADFSAPLRQGAVLGSRFPKEFGRAAVDSAKYMFSTKNYEKSMYELTQRPNYALMRSNGLAVRAAEHLTGTEEQFMSSFLEGKTAKRLGVGHIVAGSDRAYSGFLTKFRADVFDKVVSDSKAAGVKLDKKALTSLTKFVNSASGRGSGRLLDRHVGLLSAALFSPRLWKSRIDTLNPAYYARLDPTARKYALQSAASFLGVVSTILGVAKAAGAQVEFDPRSADFAKIKVGNTRYDVLGGHQQNIRLFAQMITGQKINSQTGELQTLGPERGYGKPSRLDLLYQFIENKENPVVSFASKALRGTDPTGQPINLATEAGKLAVPLTAQNIYETAKDQNSLVKGVAMNIPGVFGLGVQTYGPKPASTGGTVSAASMAPASTPDNGSILTGDNTTPEAKKLAADKKKQNEADLNSGVRLGGTKELDAAQTRIDTVAEKFPEGLSKDSQTVLTRYAKLNTSGKDKFNADLNNVYNLKAAQYEEKKRAGGMSNLEDYKAQQDLYRAKVQKDFSPDAVKLYGMSKASLRDYFASNPGQRALFNEVQQLDAALTGSGLQDKNKFYNGLSSSSGREGSLNTAKYHVSLSAGGSAKPKVATSTTKSIKRSAKRKAGAKPKVSIRKSVA